MNPKGSKVQYADWNLIKNDYIESDLSYEAIAKKHNVKIGTVTRRAGKRAGNWRQLRKEFRQKVQEKLIEKNADKDAIEIQKMKEEERKHIALLEQAAIGRLYIRELVKGEYKTIINRDLTCSDISSLSVSIERIQKMKYKSYSIPDNFNLKGSLNHEFDLTEFNKVLDELDNMDL